jgi:hypothetical protein
MNRKRGSSASTEAGRAASKKIILAELWRAYLFECQNFGNVDILKGKAQAGDVILTLNQEAALHEK